MKRMLTCILAITIWQHASAEAATLEVVQKRGELLCGTHGSRAGFSSVDSTGQFVGFDIDTCKAIAAAVLGDATKVKFLTTTPKTRFPMLQSGEVDLLANNATLTATRDTAQGLEFPVVTFFDGQGFMVPKALGVRSVQDLDGATVCVASGTNSEKTAADVFQRLGLQYEPVVFADDDSRSEAFFNGRCDVNVQTTSGLAAQRATYAENPDDYVILPELFQKDPMGPVVREGDQQWEDIVRWVVYALIQAEEDGVSSANLEQQIESTDPDVQRLLGVDPELGKAIGLDPLWARRAIAAVGNYGEMYERHFGEKSTLKLERGLNRLWSEGGVIWAAPFN